MYNDAIASYNTLRDSWYSPIHVIRGFHFLGQRYGDNINKSEFKKAKEMFVASVALLGAYEFSPENKYFLQLNKQSATPDVMAGMQTEQKGAGILLELMQMEITEFEEHFPVDDIIEFLKMTKLSSKKRYGDKTAIVCMVNRKLPFNNKLISEKIKILNPSSTVYIVGRVHGEAPTKFVIFSPFPNLTKPVKYDIAETANKYHIPPRVKFHISNANKIQYEQFNSDPENVYTMFDIDEMKVENKYKHGKN